jgi:hypothetical protein
VAQAAIFSTKVGRPGSTVGAYRNDRRGQRMEEHLSQCLQVAGQLSADAMQN